MAPVEKNKISSIVISRLRFMGDVILTTPIIRQLRKHFPAAHLSYLTEERFAPLLLHNPHLDEVIPFKLNSRSPQSRELSLLQQLQFVRDLRRKHFDLSLDLFGNPRSALLGWLSGARWRVGGDFRGRRWLYNLRVPASARRLDAIAFHQQSLVRIGLDPGDKKTEVFLTRDEVEAARDYLRHRGLDLNRPVVGLHPGATWPNKIWPTPYFARLADLLAGEGMQIFVTCGPGEEPIAKQLQSLAKSPTVVGEVFPLRFLASILHNFSLLVSNDCGTMHLAVAVGTPTFGIFGPGEPDIWFPYSADHHRAFWADIACRPCHKDYCPLGTLECMHHTQPEAVYRAALDLLKLKGVQSGKQGIG